MSAAEAARYRRSVGGGSSDGGAGGDSDDQSWHSMSKLSGSVQSEESCEESDSSMEVDLESGGGGLGLKKVQHLSRVERNCRICYLGLEGGGGGGGGGGPDSAAGILIELGCSCKGDLGAAHKQCAETWFKIKGDTTCEICGVTAFNIASEQIAEPNSTTATAQPIPAAPTILVENRTMWHGRRIMNFLLACMIVAFVVSWLFHFKVFE